MSTSVPAVAMPPPEVAALLASVMFVAVEAAADFDIDAAARHGGRVAEQSGITDRDRSRVVDPAAVTDGGRIIGIVVSPPRVPFGPRIESVPVS